MKLVRCLFLIITATLSASAQTLVCPNVTSVAPGQSTPFPVTLSAPAPSGGVFISLTTSDASTVTVTQASFIPPGMTTPASTPSITGAAAGMATITTAAFGWPTVRSTVYVGISQLPSPSPAQTPDTQPPSAPAITLTVVRGPPEVAITWTASSDNVGVAGYQIVRNGQPINSVPATTLSYSDTSVIPSATAVYAIKAYDAAGNYSSASNSVSVTTPAAASTPCTCLSSCRPITQSGLYALARNLAATPNSPPCISIDGASDVHLDCQQHTVTVDRRTNPTNQSAISVTNASDFSISNCKLATVNNSPENALLALLAVVRSPRGTITGNAITGGYVSVVNSDNTVLAHNASDGNLSVSGGNANTIEYNTIALDPSRVYNAALELSNSSGSIVQYNYLNGGWNGGPNVGADDGIIPSNLNNVTIRNNTILNTWNCGIESSGQMFNVNILNNQISTARFCGVGGWYGNSMKGVVVDGNTVTDSHMLFYYARADGLAAYLNEQQVYCQDNVLSNNKLVNPRASNSFPTLSGVLDFLDLTGIPASAVVTGNNRLANNDFGPFSLRLLPTGSIVDGGGNICVPDSAYGFPLHCQQ